jgi:hypothetical protein
VYVSPSDTGSDPFDWDSDDDGYSDGQEVVRGSDPNASQSFPIPISALGIWGRALLLLLLAGAGARGLRLRRRRG